METNKNVNSVRNGWVSKRMGHIWFEKWRSIIKCLTLISYLV